MFIIIAIVSAIAFFLIMLALGEIWTPVMTKVNFTIYNSIVAIPTMIIIFWIFGECSFGATLIGFIIGSGAVIFWGVSNVEKCSHCGAWSSYVDIERFNSESWISVDEVEDERQIYDKDNNQIGSIKGGYRYEERCHGQYDMLCRCSQCGAEHIEHRSY